MLQPAAATRKWRILKELPNLDGKNICMWLLKIKFLLEIINPKGGNSQELLHQCWWEGDVCVQLWMHSGLSWNYLYNAPGASRTDYDFQKLRERMFFCFFYVPAKSPRADLRDATLSNIDCSVVENVRKLPSTAAGVPHAHGCSSTDPSPPIIDTSSSSSRNNESDRASLVTICAKLLLLPLCNPKP